MGINFLRGNSQAPKGHAIFIARSSRDARVVYSTYCLVPPIPMSIAKYLPPMLAAQIPSEELQGASSVAGMPIPPMLEEGNTVEQLELLAERRDDDLCDIGTVSYEEIERMQLASVSCQEYAQLYANYNEQAERIPPSSASSFKQEPLKLDDMDAEDLLLQTMSERQKLAELGKLVGMARYALGGQDMTLLQETRRRMERITSRFSEKYRGTEIIAAAVSPQEKGARLAELYLSRAYKLLDEEYADIPNIEREIRDLQE
ncbi:hypothetical protein [Tengunoibacter tsumagoiensis]|uniref:Uncharacterized protein n=1 Tax=Tengunoibacter tsumagoiensis TaxID=2014871 RepID=A0A402A1R8_9CHLR|nr:hypothetical protein [Tengunoibacter tsumagoiensis]GCE13097.1 hypothetical protein KTT_29560 [Tengunoibacter tsumagoiensis]